MLFIILAAHRAHRHIGITEHIIARGDIADALLLQRLRENLARRQQDQRQQLLRGVYGAAGNRDLADLVRFPFAELEINIDILRIFRIGGQLDILHLEVEITGVVVFVAEPRLVHFQLLFVQQSPVEIVVQERHPVEVTVLIGDRMTQVPLRENRRALEVHIVHLLLQVLGDLEGDFDLVFAVVFDYR